MTRLNVLPLFSDTARSQGYAQAMVDAGYKVDVAVVVTKPEGIALGKIGKGDQVKERTTALGGVFIPDFTVPLQDSAAALADKVITVQTGTVNDAEVIEVIRDTKAGLAIYSGFGGEIVSTAALEAGPRLLHMHSGYLPDYRGSTTVYYSLLAEGRCGVSAILLKEQIDTGEMVKREWYPAPPSGMDTDYTYDVAIRSDTLLKVLDEWRVAEEFKAIEHQNPDAGDVYYVIHPLLKHLAIMGLDS